MYSNFCSGELSSRACRGEPDVAGASSEVMSAHFLSGGSGTTHCRLKMASDTSLCLICVCVWPWGPAWMLPEQGDRVQLLPLNADTHAEQWTRSHTHLHNHNLDWVSQVQSICIHGGFCIGSTTYSVSSVGCDFLLSHSEDLGLCWSVFMLYLW